MVLSSNTEPHKILSSDTKPLKGSAWGYWTEKVLFKRQELCRVLPKKCWTIKDSLPSIVEADRLCSIIRNLQRFCRKMLNNTEFSVRLHYIKGILSDGIEPLKLL